MIESGVRYRIFTLRMIGFVVKYLTATGELDTALGYRVPLKTFVGPPAAIQSNALSMI